MTTGNISFGGTLKTRHLPGYRKAPLVWSLRNKFSWAYLFGLFTNKVAAPIANKCGLFTLTSELRAVKISNGRREDFGVVSRRVVTTVFCEDMVDNLITELPAWG